MHPGWRLWGLNLLTTVLAAVLTLYVGVRFSQDNLREQVQRDAILREEARISDCRQLALTLDVYRETPPATATGQKLRVAYLDRYRALRCTPER